MRTSGMVLVALGLALGLLGCGHASDSPCGQGLCVSRGDAGYCRYFIPKCGVCGFDTRTRATICDGTDMPHTVVFQDSFDAGPGCQPLVIGCD